MRSERIVMVLAASAEAACENMHKALPRKRLARPVRRLAATCWASIRADSTAPRWPRCHVLNKGGTYLPSTLGTVLQKAREVAFTEAQQASLLAHKSYDSLTRPNPILSVVCFADHRQPLMCRPRRRLGDSYAIPSIWVHHVTTRIRVVGSRFGDMVIEAGVAAGYIVVWALRKVRRAAGQLDHEADALMDAALDRLHQVVANKIAGHPVLAELEEEASADGQISELTRQQVELALTAAARRDEAFGQAITTLLAQVRGAEQSAGVAAGARSAVFTGSADVQADNGGIAFGQVAGDVHVDRGPPGPSGPGRSGR